METYADAIGRHLSEMRERHQLTREAVARAGRRLGATWGAASVRNFEEGRAAPTLPALLILAAALSSLTSSPVTLDDLLGDATALEGPTHDGRPVSRDWVRRVLSGSSAAIRPSDFEGGGTVLIDLRDGESLREFAAQFPAEFDFEALGAVHPATLAEQRAAMRLGIAPAAVSVWSVHLWGHSLDEEAAARASGSTPQARGAMTRQLVREIEAARHG